MRQSRVRIPSYRHHKPSGQAVVTISGRDHYLGRFGSPGSRDDYDRLIAEWLAAGRRPSQSPGIAGSDRTVNELLLAYLEHVDVYYVKDGRPTTEPKDIRLAMRQLRRLYGHTLAAEFGPLALKAVRLELINSGLCRSEVNKRVGRIVRAFRWAVGEELIPAAVHQALRAVPGLRKGRSQARESEPVRPVLDASVDAIRPFVARQVWAMIELQRLTGMRPGEVSSMRTGDIARDESLWTYVPGRHKTEHHGKRRTIFLGPRAREVLRPWLRDDPDTYLFSPLVSTREF